MAFDLFLKLISGGNPIPGESINDKHKDEIDVRSFSWGESRDAGATDPQELAVVTPVSRASPQIAQLCAAGTLFESAQLSVNNATVKGLSELLMIKLSGVSVGSYQLGVAESDPQLTDRFTLAFRRIDITERVQQPDGSLAPGSSVTIDFPPLAP